MYRYYYWFKGAHRRRPGGPWWFRDFVYKQELEAFKKDTRRFLFAHATELAADCPEHEPMDIKPPNGYTFLDKEGQS